MGFLFDKFRKRKEEPIQTPKTNEEIFDEFLDVLYNLPYNEYFVSSCSDYLEEETDDTIREKLIDQYCKEVAEYMYKTIPNLDKVIRCYYVDCRDGLDFHFVFYCPSINRYFDAYHCTLSESVSNISDLEFMKMYNKPYKAQGYDFPGRKRKTSEEELRTNRIDCTEEAKRGELYKYCNGNMDYIKKKRGF